MSKRTRTRLGHADPTAEQRRRRERVARGYTGAARSRGRYTTAHVHDNKVAPRRHALCDRCMDVVERGRGTRSFRRAVELELRRLRSSLTIQEPVDHLVDLRARQRRLEKSYFDSDGRVPSQQVGGGEKS